MIGVETFDEIHIKTHPYEAIAEDVIVTKRLFGLPYEYKDMSHKYLQFDRYKAEAKTRKHLREDDYNLLTVLRVFFVETIVTQQYYTPVDLASGLGGFSGSVSMLI